MADLRKGVTFPRGYAESWLSAAAWSDDTPFQRLEKWAAEAPERMAIQSVARSLTYAELQDSVLRAAALFRHHGIAAGDCVGLQLPNIPEMLISGYALQRIGAVATLLHMPYRERALAPLLRLGDVKAIVCWTGLNGYNAPATMRELCCTVPSLQKILVVGEAPPGTEPFDLSAQTPDTRVERHPADPMMLAFTSGTSSAPKAVLHPAYTISANQRIMSHRCDIRSKDRVLSAPPFTHVYGMSVAGITLYAGATVVLMDLFSPQAFAAAINTCRASMVFCAPAHFLAARSLGAFDDRAVTNGVRRIILAGATCPPEVFEQVEESFSKATPYQMFGMTEILMSTINAADASRDVRMRSIGIASDNQEFRITAPDGSVLAPDEEGELESRGSFMFSGYFGNDEANKFAFRENGWFRTGDLGRMDREGNIYLSGRLKDIINRGGIKINPAEIEAIIISHEDVVLAAIAPMKDPVLGERACLFVQLKPDTTLTLEEVCTFLGSRGVAKMLWPERLEKVAAMPMTPTRKISKEELIKLLR